MKLILCLFFTFCFSLKAQYVKKDQLSFFPNNVSSFIKSYNSFSIMNWNFIFVDGNKNVESICSDITKNLKEFTEIINCNDNISQFHKIIKEYSEDTSNLTPYPGKTTVLDKLNSTLGKLIFLPSSENTVAIKRSLIIDPLERYNSFIEKNDFAPNGSIQKNGSLYFPNENTYIIPILFNFSNFEATKLNKVNEIISNAGANWTGPHFFSFQNRLVVDQDLKTVSIVTISILTFLFFILIINKRSNILIIFPVIIISGFLSALILILINGSIHGLTLSFGPGLLGLSFDYAAHRFFHNNSQKVWKSNFYGLITTLSILIALQFSQMPLLKELGIFSTIGLTISFLFLILLDKKSHFNFKTHPFSFSIPRPSKKSFIISIFLMILGPILFFKFNKIDFSLSQFEFTDDRIEKSRIFFKKVFEKESIPYYIFIPKDEKAIDRSSEHKNFALKNNINFQGTANFVPALEMRKSYFSSWKKSNIDQVFKENENFKIFKEFRHGLTNSYLKSDEYFLSREYIKLYSSKDKLVSIFFPKSSSEVKLLKKKFPSLSSIKTIISNFPKALAKDIVKIFLTSFFIIFALVFFRYKNLKKVIEIFIPFITSLSTIFLGLFLTSTPFTFVGMIGSLIVYGMSIDYSIFVTDFNIHTKEFNQTVNAMILAACSTFFGFLPLLFCGHPILFQLGLVIILGLIGTIIGSFIILPYGQKLYEKN